jgi:hypothetical protein
MKVPEVTATNWKAVVRFATEPDDPRQIAAQLATLVTWEQMGVGEAGDLEVVLHVPADDAYDAARMMLDRVQSATAETDFAAPELLEVSVLCMYGGVDPQAVT